MKIIASDFDGTLRRNGEVSVPDREAIKRWQAAGNLFGYATGRGYKSIEPAGEYVKADFFVCCGGAAVYDGDGRLLISRRLEFDTLYILERLATEYEVPYFSIQRDNGLYVLRREGEVMPLPEEHEPYFLAPFAFPSEADAKRFAKDVKSRYGDIFNPQHNGGCVDVAKAGVTKATGIYDYMKLVNIRKEDIITVGDNYNDYEMITEFKGVTVSEGVQAIKDISRAVYNDFTELTEDNY